MEKTIYLRRESEADDLQCADGEVVNSALIFGEKETGSGGNGSNGGSGSKGPDGPWKVSVESGMLPLPTGGRFLCLHRLPEAGVNAVVQRGDGLILFAPAGGSDFWKSVSPVALPAVSKAVSVGSFLVFLTLAALYYALWNGREYVWLGSDVPAPQPVFSVTGRALPPYSYTDTELPSLTLRMDIKGDADKDVLDWLAGTSIRCSSTTRRLVAEAVASKLKEFVNAVRGAGLAIGPVRCAAAWELADGSLWQLTEPVFIGGSEERVTLRIVSADCTDGVLYLNLELSRRPFEVVSEIQLPATSSGWNSLVKGARTFVSAGPSDILNDSLDGPLWVNSGSRGFSAGKLAISTEEYGELPGAYGVTGSEGLPDDIFSIGERLLTVYRQGTTRKANLVATSAVGLPAMQTGVGVVAGAPLLHLTQSLRSLSSGQFGDFPLYAFCGDGIRALTPSEGSYRDVQLISRDVAISARCFAPLPDATCFLTEAGVMKIEGTSVSCISRNTDIAISPKHRLLYLYADNLLVLFEPGNPEARIYNIATGKWGEAAIAGGITDFHYAWPSCWLQIGSTVGKAVVEDMSAEAWRLARGQFTPVPIVTRPVKLGAPFALKQMEEVHTLWPDGSVLPVKVYGSLRLDKWYFLGQTRGSRMRMRGSGWRFFRFETFAVPTGEGGYHLPAIRCLYK